MSFIQPSLLTKEIRVPSLIPQQETPTKGFSTESCFLWLHDKNIEFSRNVRGEINHEYNRKLREQGLATHCIPGGEDFRQLGRDQATSIVRPDFYLQACQKVMSNLTNTPFAGLSLSTANFFDLLHQENVNNRANVRGLINQRYNQLLSEAGICAGRIPGDNLEQLGMDKGTPLKADLYLKAYEAVIVNPKAFLLCSPSGPFQNLHPDVFLNMTQFMGPDDIFKCGQVCKNWDDHSKKRCVWQRFFEENKYPYVESAEKQNYRREYLTLCKVMPLNGRTVERLFGPFGDIPDMSRACFEKFFQKDPFEPGKFMWETSELFVVPDAVFRTSCKEFPCNLNKDGNLVDLCEPSGEELRVKCNFWNLHVLFGYPLPGKHDLPGFVFSWLDEDIKKCNTCLDKVILVFMRTCVANGSRGKSYTDQEKLVEEQGFKVTPFRERLFWEITHILRSGKYPPFSDDSPKVRTPDVVVRRGVDYQVCIAVFIYHIGMVFLNSASGDPEIGVVPCISAEVPQPPALEPPALDKGD